MNDTDFFEQFIKLLDAALASDDPKIQKALRKFMFILSLNLSDDECEPGPFSKMMDAIDDLQRRISAMELKDSGNDFTTTVTTWPPAFTSTTPYIAPSTTGGSITTTGTGTTNWVNLPMAASTTGTFTLDLGDQDSGTEIKNDINEKIAKLVKAT